MSHSGQLYKLLFVPNTLRVRRYDIVYKVDVNSKHECFTPYCKLGSRFCTISTPNIDFGIMPQSSCKVPVMIEMTVEWS